MNAWDGRNVCKNKSVWNSEEKNKLEEERSNRRPRETILLDGCNYEHWLVVMEFSENPKPSKGEMIASYVKTPDAVVGNEEAKKKIYSVNGLLSVLWVLPDSYPDVPNKDYGRDLFVDGKVIHRPQLCFNARQNIRNGPPPRYDKQRKTVQVDLVPFSKANRESRILDSWCCYRREGEGQCAVFLLQI
ncbi:hypothetical protein AAC387_Pa11g1221 [Persea americana]